MSNGEDVLWMVSVTRNDCTNKGITYLEGLRVWRIIARAVLLICLQSLDNALLQIYFNALRVTFCDTLIFLQIQNEKMFIVQIT